MRAEKIRSGRRALSECSFIGAPRRGLGVSFGISRDSISVRVDASPCCSESVANLRAKNRITRECKCVLNQAECVRADYEAAALTAELPAPRLRNILA